MQAKAEYAPYYKNSLLYLACVDPAKDLTPDQRVLRAHDLGLAAFLGDTIYNFGELVSRRSFMPYADTCRSLRCFTIHTSIWTRPQLMHPILGALDGTPHEWIKKLLFTFNEGNIGKFEALAPLFPKEVR